MSPEIVFFEESCCPGDATSDHRGTVAPWRSRFRAGGPCSQVGASLTGAYMKAHRTPSPALFKIMAGAVASEWIEDMGTGRRYRAGEIETLDPAGTIT